MSTVRVLIADDQTIIRDGLRALLSAYSDINVIAEAENGQLAYEQVKKHRPQVVLMDIRMPVMDGVEATRLIKEDFPDTAIIVLTTFDDDEYIISAMTNGASGYLLKDIGAGKLVEAIRDGMRGSIILPGLIASKITSRLVKEKTPQIEQDDFSLREQEVINLMMLGKSNKDIAQELYLSVGTIKNYISQIYSKIDVTDRTNAVLIFKKLGF